LQGVVAVVLHLLEQTAVVAVEVRVDTVSFLHNLWQSARHSPLQSEVGERVAVLLESPEVTPYLVL
jgi:hypothetical protein